MSDELRPEELLHAWRASAVPVEPRSELERERSIEVVRRAVMAETARSARRRRAWAGGALAAAAALLIGIGAASWKLGLEEGKSAVAVSESIELSISERQGGVVLQRDGKTTLLEQPAASLSAGDQLETLADGKALLRTDHSRWHLGRSTRVKLIAAGRAGERLQLASGRVDVDVTKAKERLVVVVTPHAQVQVVGTAFSVQVHGDGNTAETNVEVTRGVVLVLQGDKQQARLEAGQRWSSRAEQTSAATGPTAEPQRAVPSAAQQGTLDDENKLYGAALDARNRGDNAAAARLSNELLTRFPRSMLAEGASGTRLEALERMGRQADARAEAKRYLARFPRGPAREKAERVLADQR